MAVAPLANTLEGGSDGVAISAANSGGASGDAFSAVIKVSGTANYSIDHAAHGTMSAKFTYPASGAEPYLQWDGLGDLTISTYVRQYIYLPSDPGVQLFIGGMFSSGGSRVTYVRITTPSLRFQMTNAAGTTATTSTAAIALGQWVRIEYRVLPSTTVGELEWRLFNNADSATADDTGLVTGQVLTPALDRAVFGTPGSSASVYTHYQEDFAVSTSGWIGSAVVQPQLIYLTQSGQRLA